MQVAAGDKTSSSCELLYVGNEVFFDFAHSARVEQSLLGPKDEDLDEEEEDQEEAEEEDHNDNSLVVEGPLHKRMKFSE